MEIQIPGIGDFRDVPVIEVHVSPGQTVAVDDPLVTLESDKATMDVPAPVAGTVSELRVAVGDTVSEGSVIMVLDGAGVPSTPPKERVHESNHRIIGCGIVGPNAGELIAEAALAIEMGADAADIDLTIHPHPTLSETVGMAAEAFEGTITDLYVPRKR